LLQREKLIVFTACFLLGCGYHFGARLPEDIVSVEVPIFSNNTLIRGVEFELTDALTRELKSRTPAKLVDGGADAVLSGTVAAYRKVPVYESGGEVIAGRITVTVSFRLSKSAPGNALIEGSETETQDYDTRVGVTELDARREAVREIARKIISGIEAW
jgi:hypothetical protein